MTFSMTSSLPLRQPHLHRFLFIVTNILDCIISTSFSGKHPLFIPSREVPNVTGGSISRAGRAYRHRGGKTVFRYAWIHWRRRCSIFESILPQYAPLSFSTSSLDGMDLDGMDDFDEYRDLSDFGTYCFLGRFDAVAKVIPPR
jgi:hypothetical protein